MRHRFLLLTLLLPAFGACSSDSANGVTSAAATTTVAPVASNTPAGGGAIQISDFKFGPATINVPVGSSVVWTNNDDQQHTATSAGNFDAGAIQPGSSATVELETAGTFTYICSFHPFMMGTVVVG